MTDKVQKILSEIATRKLCTMDEHMAFYNDKAKEDYRLLSEIEGLIKALQEEPVSEQNLSNVQRTVKNWKEPVSEDLEEAVNAYIGYAPEVDESSSVYGKRQAFKAGAKWQKEHLWKPADGDDLPEIDREVIVFTQHYPLEGNDYAVSFAHRPNPDGWNGKSLTSGKVEHYTPKTYDKGGWNIPDAKYWLDVELPKEMKDE
jgi:hypothetical protein